ncbi:MAG TPA: sigma-54 dependent transcriptional regulator [bacterium]|nr:sigma-54 dependent transcriptional regulator [bacterium]
MRAHLLIVDDEEGVRESFRMALQDQYALTFAADARSALKELKRSGFDLCLLDIMLPDGSGLDLLEQVKRRDPDIEVIMVTALQGVETARTAMKGKARDYITKPFRVDDLLELIPQVLARRKGTGDAQTEGLLRAEWRGGLGADLSGTARSGKAVWIVGEPGTGIEEAAREVHRSGPGARGPFVRLECGSIGEGALERELFGVEKKGKASQVGKVEFAQGGSLFLVDADKLPEELQTRLARALSPQALGRPDVRLIASGPQGPKARTENGGIIEEFGALFGDPVTLAPLRKRAAEVPAMVQRYLERSGSKVREAGKDVLDFLARYPWPGNLTELEGCLETMVRFAADGTLTLEDVPLDMLLRQAELDPAKGPVRHILKKVSRQFERKYIRRVLERTRGNQTQAAKTLGLHRNTLILKLKELKLEADYQRIVRTRRESRAGFRQP